jgi:hypothetical protein
MVLEDKMVLEGKMVSQEKRVQPVRMALQDYRVTLVCKVPLVLWVIVVKLAFRVKPVNKVQVVFRDKLVQMVSRVIVA